MSGVASEIVRNEQVVRSLILLLRENREFMAEFGN
jgi:hypothetical protein